MGRRAFLKSHVSTFALFFVAAAGGALATPAMAAPVGGCTQDASGNLTCSGVVTDTGTGNNNTAGTTPNPAPTLPITLYDVAAQYQPVAGGNGYPATNYNQNPATLQVTINPGAVLTGAITAANASTFLSDKGLISANYSNSEDPAVNNVLLTNYGSIALTTNQIYTTRAEVINSDSQVNNFTVNNSGTVSVAQTYFTTFNKSYLGNASSTLTSNGATPATYSATQPLTLAAYYGPTGATYGTPSKGVEKMSDPLNDMADFYSDDNTNEFVVNNAATGQALATGNFATVYYGRADTTITNSGTISNTSWVPTDTIANGHWAIAAYAGTDYNTAPNTNPDSTIVLPNADGSVTVNGTSALTLTNNAGGTIKGDILALDITPLVYAAAVGTSTNPFPNPGQTTLLQLPVSSSNAGPRDSNIENYGTIQGNFYLGSGTHVIDNAAGASLQGSVYVDQRPFQAVFSEPTPAAGQPAGTYVSAGGTDFNGTACSAAGATTTDAGCATTTKSTATVVGGQSLTLTNEGTFTGDIRIFDQATSVNSITLNGTGFTGNVVAVNGTGSNSLTLNGVTQLASVQNFSFVDLMQSNVAVTNGVSLVSGAQINTTIFGRGGTMAAPTTNLGSIQGTLTLAGATNITPTFAAIAHNGDVYQLATMVTGAGANSVTADSTTLVTVTPSVSPTGALLLTTTVQNPNSVPGITPTGAQTLGGLLGYTGTNPQVQALGAAVESLSGYGAVDQAATALSPIVNGADVQAPIDATMIFQQQIGTRLDAFIYAQVPSSGRSADLGPQRVVPVYGALPPNGAWIQGVGGGLQQNPVAGVAGYNAEFEGVLAGYDRAILPGLRVGGAFGYVDTRVNGQVNLQTREGIQTYEGLGYAEFAQDHYYVRGSAGYGQVNYQSTRQITFPGFTDTAFGSHNGNIFTARGEAGLLYEAYGDLFVPYAAFTYGHLNQDAYAETSAAGAALTFGATTNSSERSEVGGKVVVPLTGIPTIATLFPVATSTLALEAHAAYVHEFGNVGQTVTAAFAGGNFFTVSGPIPDREMVDYGIGLGMSSGHAIFDITYNGLARSTFLEQYGLARVRYVF